MCFCACISTFSYTFEGGKILYAFFLEGKFEAFDKSKPQYMVGCLHFCGKVCNFWHTPYMVGCLVNLVYAWDAARDLWCQISRFRTIPLPILTVKKLTVGYGHFECDCHQDFRTEVVSPGSFPALLLRKISSLMSTIFSL